MHEGLRRPSLLIVALLALCAAPAEGQRPENHLDTLPRAASSTTTVVPIFSQLLLFSTPKDFKAVAEAQRDNRYAQQSVPLGQDLAHWSEMVTVTGEKNAATLQGVTPQKLAEAMAGAFRQSCPDSFSVASFGPLKVDRHDGFAVVIGCGLADAAGTRSQGTLVVTIKGERDMYTLQWAVSGPPQKAPLAIDPQPWQDRLARLAPVRLCTPAPDEAAPYASCTQKKF